MGAILTAEDVVRRIAAECAYVDERGGVGIRLEPAARDRAAVWRTIPPAATLGSRGHGRVDGEKWVHDYLGYLVPDWPDGVNQVVAIVGSVIRRIAHSGGEAAAGVVCSVYAVERG
jgi:hypothetical protein